MVHQTPEDWLFVCGAQRAHKESGKVVTLPLVFPYGADQGASAIDINIVRRLRRLRRNHHHHHHHCDAVREVLLR